MICHKDLINPNHATHLTGLRRPYRIVQSTPALQQQYTSVPGPIDIQRSAGNVHHWYIRRLRRIWGRVSDNCSPHHYSEPRYTDVSLPERGKLRIIIAGCHATLYGNSGVFASPNYPAIYENNLRCSWLITTDFGTAIVLRFNSFSTEQCCDFVTVGTFRWKFQGGM